MLHVVTCDSSFLLRTEGIEMAESPSLSKRGRNPDKQEDEDDRLKRIKRELKQWEHSFNNLNGRPPQKHDIGAFPSIHALYGEYACLKKNSKTQGIAKHATETGTSLNNNRFCHGAKSEPGATEHHKRSSETDTEASDDSHISATPPRKQPANSPGSRSCKFNVSSLDDISRALPEKLEGKVANDRLKNDSIFLGEKDGTVRILGKGSKKVSLRNRQTCKTKFVQPGIPSSENANDGNVALSSQNLSELGFSIRLRRPGGPKEEGIPNNNSTADRVPPGFFSSCTPSSLVKLGCKSLPNKLSASNVDSAHEPYSQSSFSELHADTGIFPANMSRHVSAQVLGNINCDSRESNENCTVHLEQSNHKNAIFSDSHNRLSAKVPSTDTNKTAQENRFATPASNRIFPATDEAPESIISQENYIQDQNLGGSVLPNKAVRRSKRGKCKDQQQLQECNSWSNPKALKKVARKHQSMNINTKVDALNSAPGLSVKHAQRGNFVKLNLNGKGPRFRKFVNKGSKRKRLSSGQNFRGGEKFKRDNTHGGINPLNEADDAEMIDVDENGNHQKESKARSLRGQRWQSTSETGHSEEACGDYKCFQTEEENTYDQALLTEAAENALREPSDQNLLSLLKITYGFSSFRNGQLETIKRVVAKQSTMLVLPTGSGKSLCYQLPALILPGVTVVISPLVALMVDQLRHLPPMISGSLLSSSQTGKETSETLDRLRRGAIKVLFISPERLLNDHFLSIMGGLPLISLVVVDEAHCLSEWSHNFRPSYFRIGSILRKKLRVECVLAMTATATKKTLQSILCSLQIPPSEVVQVSHIRENLQLSVSLSENRLKDLLSLMKSPPFLEAHNVIIYCKFQSETDFVSKFLRDNNIPAKSYHSGITAKDRNRTQDMFCHNKLRVVVATVAFGMGLDKSDVQAVIHYSLPGSLEHYVQETGRAGRDGRLAHCHLFLDYTTYFKLRSLAHSDGADEYAVNKFLSAVFLAYKDIPSHVCFFNIASASRNCDLKEEVMATILSYLEVGEVQYLQMLPQLNATCSMCFHKSLPALLAKRSILIDAVLKRTQSKHGHYVFEIPTLANDIGVMVADVLRELEKLQFLGEITYELKDPAFCYIILKVPENICSLTTLITAWLGEVEASKVQKLDTMYFAATHAIKNPKQLDGGVSIQQSCLQRIIHDYFNSDEILLDISLLNKIQPSSSFLRADIKVFLQNNMHMNFTARAVARILHSISSPAYPSAIWSKNHFWGRYCKIDFNVVKEAAAVEILAYKGRPRVL